MGWNRAFNMKICFLCEYFPPKVNGGAEVSLNRLINEIQQEIEVHVLTPNYDDYTEKKEKRQNFTIHHFKSKRIWLHNRKKKTGGNNSGNSPAVSTILSIYQIFSARELAKKFNQLNKKENFNFVIANNIESNLALPYINGNITKIGYLRDLAMMCPCYRTCNGEYCEKCGTKQLQKCLNTNWLRTILTKKLSVDYRKKQIMKTPNYIAINKYCAKNLVLEGYTGKIFVIYDPMSKEIISTKTKQEARKNIGITNQKLFFFSGSLTKIKGAHLLNEISENLDDNSILLVAGDGPLREQLTNPRIKLLGKLKPEELKDYYKAADAFLLPSIVHYGCGMVQVEAQANQTPVITFDINGIEEEIINNETGIIVKTPKEMAENALELAENQELRDKITKNAMKLVQKHQIEKTARDFLAMLEVLT